jgi:hypothetical protein
MEVILYPAIKNAIITIAHPRYNRYWFLKNGFFDLFRRLYKILLSIVSVIIIPIVKMMPILAAK